MELDYFDSDSSFNLLNIAFDKVNIDNYFNRNLIQTIAKLTATTFSSAGTPIATSYATVSQPTTTNWSNA